MMHPNDSELLDDASVTKRHHLDSNQTLPQRLGKGVRGSVQKLLPEIVIQEARSYRSYEKNERLIYLKLRIANGLGFFHRKLARPPKTARKFLFVCFGNIIRSPMCEALMKRELDRLGKPQFTVASAGLNATPGRAAHPWAIAAAQELGISLEQHRARVLTPEMVDHADVICAMDYQNHVQLLSRFANASNKIFMLAAFAGQKYRSVEINDPYHGDEEETRCCYQVLNTCIQALVRSLAG